MRVIAGRYRGRRLASARTPELRPTSDRVREALFAVLGADVEGARVLDLYAGTGALAIEALSRGAEEATCVERARRALEALRANVETLGISDRVTVVRADTRAFCRRVERDGERYDVVLADPPYRLPLEPLERELLSPAWWSRACVIEHAADREPPEPPPGVTARTRRYGDAAFTVYRRA